MAKGRRITADASDDLPKAKLSFQNLKKSLRLFSFVGKHKWKFFLGLFFLGGTVFTALVFPKLIGNLMGLVGNSGEHINKDFQLETAYDIGIKLLVLFAFQAIFSFFRVVTFTNFTEHMLASIRKAAYEKLIQIPMSFFSER